MPDYTCVPKEGNSIDIAPKESTAATHVQFSNSQPIKIQTDSRNAGPNSSSSQINLHVFIQMSNKPSCSFMFLTIIHDALTPRCQVRRRKKRTTTFAAQEVR